MHIFVNSIAKNFKPFHSFIEKNGLDSAMLLESVVKTINVFGTGDAMFSSGSEDETIHCQND